MFCGCVNLYCTCSVLVSVTFSSYPKTRNHTLVVIGLSTLTNLANVVSIATSSEKTTTEVRCFCLECFRRWIRSAAMPIY